MNDYGRYKRSRQILQVAEAPHTLQPAEITNVPQPEQITQHSTKESGSDLEHEIWSFDRAINEVFRLLPQELCPRPTEEHTPSKPLSGIEHLMELHTTPLLVLPQSKLVDMYFFSYQDYAPFLSYGPLKKYR